MSLLTNKPLDLSHVKDHKSETCFVDYVSDMDPSDAERLVGKTVARVDAYEAGLKLTFDDGVTLELSWLGGSNGLMTIEVADAAPTDSADNQQPI